MITYEKLTKVLARKLKIPVWLCARMSENLALTFIENVEQSTKALTPEEVREWYGPILDDLDFKATRLSGEMVLKIIKYMGYMGWYLWLKDILEVDGVEEYPPYDTEEESPVTQERERGRTRAELLPTLLPERSGSLGLGDKSE